MTGTDPMSDLEERGYFLLRGALSRAACQEIRDFVDRTIDGGHIAERIRRLPAPGFYDTFPASMEQAMPAPLRSLLER